jgi:hypothetical protein
MSCSSTDISNGAGGSAGVGSVVGSAREGAAGGVIDWVVTGIGVLYATTGAGSCANVRFGFGLEYSAHPTKAKHAHTTIAVSRMCIFAPSR